VGGVAAELPDYAGPGRTGDGQPVQLLLNLGSAADLATGGGGAAAARARPGPGGGGSAA